MIIKYYCKMVSGIAYNWCVLLDIALILALMKTATYNISRINLHCMYNLVDDNKLMVNYIYIYIYVYSYDN